MHRLVSNTLSLTFIQIANYLAPLVTLVHLANVLGPETYGILAFGQAIVVLSSMIIDFGFNLSATHKIAKYRKSYQYVSRLIGGIYALKLIIFGFCLVVICVFANETDRYADHKNFLILNLLPILFQSLYPLWFFQGLEKMKLLAFISVLIKLLFVGLVFFFVKISEDYLLVPIFNAISQCIGVLLSIWMIYQLGYRVRFPSRRIITYCFRFSRHFFVSRVGVLVYMNSAVFILGLVASPIAVATYSIAEQLYKAMQSAISPLSAAVYPFMSKEKNTNLMLKLTYGCVLVTFSGALFGYFVSPMLLPLLFDDSWASSLSILNVFFVAVVIHAGAVMTGYPLAAAVGRVDVANSSVITGALIYCLGVGLLVWFGGVTPMMLACLMVVSELGVLAHRALVLMPLARKLS